MKCALCGGRVTKKRVEEEVRSNKNHVMVEVVAEVCESCNERYFDSEVMDKLIHIKETFGKEKKHFERIGLVYKFAT